jgi:hypothetical protein
MTAAAAVPCDGPAVRYLVACVISSICFDLLSAGSFAVHHIHPELLSACVNHNANTSASMLILPVLLSPPLLPLLLPPALAAAAPTVTADPQARARPSGCARPRPSQPPRAHSCGPPRPRACGPPCPSPCEYLAK